LLTKIILFAKKRKPSRERGDRERERERERKRKRRLKKMAKLGST
jgi:hypothetical protein